MYFGRNLPGPFAYSRYFVSFPGRIYISTGPQPVHPTAGLLKRREINGIWLFVLIANADNMMNRQSMIYRVRSIGDLISLKGN